MAGACFFRADGANITQQVKMASIILPVAQYYFRAPIFPVSFAESISRFPVPYVRKILTGLDGKPVSMNAVYKWQRGESCPEPWEQVLILKALGNPPAAATSEPGKRGRGRPRKDSGPAAVG